MLNLQKIGSKISTLRKEKKMKQNELADTLYVTHQAVSKWENGKSIPSIEILYELTKLFEVSIDFLLNDVEIENDNYESLFKNFPREVVISKFIQKENLDTEAEKIFYLLKKDERKIILNKIINKTVSLNLESIWHLLSKSERWYILNIIISKKFKYDLNKIYVKLNDMERHLVNNHFMIVTNRTSKRLLEKGR